MALVHRRPAMDFSGVPAHWCNHLEFGLFWVAGSTGAPAAEPYLNQVLAQAKPMLGPRHQHLKPEIDLFIKQETEHFKIHNAYNAELSKTYPTLMDGYNAKRADYREFLATKSHKFNCAYSAAFETMALSLAMFLFEECDDYLEGCDQRTLDMWKWHLGEEYEHRAVCHDVYCAVYGDYFTRARMILYAYKHLGGHNRRIYAQLIAQERARMSAAEVAESIEREKAMFKKLKAFQLPRLMKLFVPGYNPGASRAPRGVQQVLDAFAPA